ncbi:MAG: carboxypeptidase regulatory-like domain-containing protein [Bryobacterales bacterium]|nr:carboxypeptidase regulatory-like domain-containing protein [Bryobacterales bacterium]
MLIAILLLCSAHAQTPGKITFDGQVVNSLTGEPVRKASLTLEPTAKGEPVSAAAGLDGKFLFPEVPAGVYRLIVRKEGFAEVTIGRRNGPPGLREPLSFATGDRKTAYAVKLTPLGVITGRVLDTDGDPIRGIPVAALSYHYTSKGREFREVRTGTTNDLGQYRIFDLNPGKYFVRTSPRNPLRVTPRAEDTEFYMSHYYPGVPEPRGATMIEVQAGREVSGIEFSLPKTRFANISGRVNMPEGATNGSIGLMAASDTGTSTSTTSLKNKDGKFQMSGVAPGLLHVIGSYTLNGLRHSATAPVQVAYDDISGIELNPIAPMDVPGTVRIEGQHNTKTSEINISLEGPGRNVTATVDDQGRLSFRNVEPGAYRINPGAYSGLYLKSVSWGTADVTDGEIDLRNGLPPRSDVTVVLSADGGELTGSVRDDEQKSATGIVALVPTSGHRSPPSFKFANVTDAGNYTLRGIAPGSYKIYAWDSVDRNAVMYDPTFLPQFDSTAKTVEIGKSEKKALDLVRVLLPDSLR